MKTMQHKGYAARIEYSEEDKCFVGHVAGSGKSLNQWATDTLASAD